jgi:Tfp pilus assembly protein PilV
MTPQPRLRSQLGVTLMETVMVILLLSIASAAIIGLNGGLYKNSKNIASLQTDTQWLQACAESVVMTRRISGFNAAPNYLVACQALPNAPLNKFAVTTTTSYTGSSCPTNATCQLVAISVNVTTGGVIGPTNLLLVKY